MAQSEISEQALLVDVSRSIIEAQKHQSQSTYILDSKINMHIAKTNKLRKQENVWFCYAKINQYHNQTPALRYSTPRCARIGNRTVRC